MAQIKIPTSVTGPDEINISLIRADYAEISYIFRVCFEVSLALFCTVLGHVFSINGDQRKFIHWFTFGLLFLATIAFLYLSNKHHNKAKSK